MALTPVHELQTLIRDKIADHPQPLETETVHVAAAVGRVLAQDIVSAVNIPPPTSRRWTATPCNRLQTQAASGQWWANPWPDKPFQAAC